MPWLLAIPPFLYGVWSVGLVIVVGGNLLVTGRLRLQHKSIGSLELTSLALVVFVAIGYFCFGNVFFIQHFGVMIYSLLLIPVLYGEIRGQPFTAQYAKQMYSSDRWATRTFFEGTRFLSRLWGAIFVVSILLAVFGINTLELIVLPNLLVVLALVFGPRIGHWYAIRFSPKGAE